MLVHDTTRLELFIKYVRTTLRHETNISTTLRNMATTATQQRRLRFYTTQRDEPPTTRQDTTPHDKKHKIA